MPSIEYGRYRLDEVQTALALLQGMADGAPAAGLGLGPGLNPSTFFAGRLDMRCTAIGGHSYGGATAVATAATDARIRACVTLDPWWCAAYLLYTVRRLVQLRNFCFGTYVTT